MKKLLFFAMLLALAACETGNGMKDSKDVETNYISINLVTAAGTGTRADAYDPAGGENKDYEDGTDTENTVKSIRFYFFDAGKEAVAVKKSGDGYVSYLDWPGGDGTEIKDEGSDHANTVEKILNAMLIINPAEKGKVPAFLVAVLNPTKEIKEASIANVSKLTELIDDYSAYTADNFIMSNSVFANGDEEKVKVDAVNVEKHLYTTAEAALADPVTVYVERVLAKATLSTTLTAAKEIGGEKLYLPNKAETTAGAGDGKDYKYNGKQIYVKFLGWNVTATAKTSRLMKEINSGWEDKDLFGSNTPWNWAGVRSFWAVNPGTMAYNYFDFGLKYDKDTGEYVQTEDGKKAANALTVGQGIAYMQENAAESLVSNTVETPTKVIIAAQLVDESGDPMEFAEFAFEQYTVEALKVKYAELSNIYIITTETSGTKYTKITAEDIKLVTATAAGQADENRSGRYYTYANINMETKKTYCIGNTEGAPAATEEAINEELVKLGHAKVWTNGFTYYYFDIKHLGTSVGEYGVVRNHVYKSVVDGLTGLGTPVYNPDEVIYPEKPGDEDTFLAAQIKILSWRIVNGQYKLDW